MDLVYRRFRYDDSSTNERKEADASALAALRFPWCARYACDDIQPITLSGADNRDWVGSANQDDLGTTNIDDAWLVIADVLLPISIASASSVEVARQQLDELKPIATMSRYAEANQRLMQIERLAGQAEVRRNPRPKTSGIQRRQPRHAAGDVIMSLTDLDSAPCLRDQRGKEERWAMSLLRTGRISGNLEERKRLAMMLRQGLTYQAISIADGARDREACLLLAATDRAAGDEGAAQERLASYFKRGAGFERFGNARACIAAGYRPTAREWEGNIPLLYFLCSPALGARSFQFGCVLLLLASALAPVQPFARFGLVGMFGCTLITGAYWPIPPSGSLVSAWEQEESRPTIWIVVFLWLFAIVIFLAGIFVNPGS